MIGKNLGHYKVLEPLGAGGMGEVYRATDTTLKRDVAIKVLPEDLADDPDRLARLEREAHLLAALNHSNIATVHSLEEADGTRFLVMELVKGESLEGLIAAGPLPVEKALGICAQIARALEAAHAEGIIHRDLKPANVLLTPDGHAKVLDFGLAKATATADSTDADLSRSPTVTVAGTRTGVILGTAPYMSPEQVRGQTLDKRTDIWAFGCVLYETLTGKRAFNRETVADTLAAVLDAEPDWRGVPTATPPMVAALIRRCLRKDPDRRLHDIADARIEIEEAIIDPTIAPSPVAGAQPTLSGRLMPLLGTAIVVVIASLLVWYAMGPEPPESPSDPVRFTIPAAPAERLGVTDQLGIGRMRLSRTAVALSPDGRYLVYVGGDEDSSRLYLRRMNEDEAKAIDGTEGAIGPFFSPHGDRVGFWAEGEIRSISLDGGPAVTICEYEQYPPFGASWGSDGTIVLGQARGGLLQVSDSGGGSASPLTTLDLDRFELSHRLPHHLPDGRGVLFTVRHASFGAWQSAEVWVASGEEGQVQRTFLLKDGADAQFVGDGHLVFTRFGSLMVAPFDPAELNIGSVWGVADGIQQAISGVNSSSDTGAAQVSVSDDGTLVYIRGPNLVESRRTLLWVTRDGEETPVAIPPDFLGVPRISPTGERAVIRRTEDDTADLWVFDLANPYPMTRLTRSLQYEIWPMWIDGAEVGFQSSGAEAPGGIYRMRAQPDSSPELVLDRRCSTNGGTCNVVPGSSLPDGTLAYMRFSFDQREGTTRSERGDIWVIPAGGEPTPLLATPDADERYPAFSPDGRWLAYGSDISGAEQIWVQAYPGTGDPVMISTAGGTEPGWSRDGREIFYRGVPDENGIRWMMAAEFDQATGSKIGQPRPLFRWRYRGTSPVRAWDVADDGRFLMELSETLTPEEDAIQIQVVLNWFEELKRLVPTGGSR